MLAWTIIAQTLCPQKTLLMKLKKYFWSKSLPLLSVRWSQPSVAKELPLIPRGRLIFLSGRLRGRLIFPSGSLIGESGYRKAFPPPADRFDFSLWQPWGVGSFSESSESISPSDFKVTCFFLLASFGWSSAGLSESVPPSDGQIGFGQSSFPIFCRSGAFGVLGPSPLGI